jgi:hypothetical protein
MLVGELACSANIGCAEAFRLQAIQAGLDVFVLLTANAGVVLMSLDKLDLHTLCVQAFGLSTVPGERWPLIWPVTPLPVRSRERGYGVRSWPDWKSGNRHA